MEPGGRIIFVGSAQYHNILMDDFPLFRVSLSKTGELDDYINYLLFRVCVRDLADFHLCTDLVYFKTFSGSKPIRWSNDQAPS